MVELQACEVVAIELPLVRIRLRSSAGFYVRSLAQELGRVLGCGACLEGLRRTASGTFTLAEAAEMTVLEADPAAATSRLIPLEHLLLDLPAVRLDEAAARRAGHGNEVALPEGAADPAIDLAPAVRLFDPEGKLLAIARRTERPGVLHPAVVLK